jgi:proline dehydrogenase
MGVADVARAGLLAASRSRMLRQLAVRQGMRLGARRFVAGTTLDDFVAAARAQLDLGRVVAAGYLGEGVRSAADAARIARDFEAIVERIAAERLAATVAVKLSHLGLDVGEDEAERNLRAVVDRARDGGVFVRIDMEEGYRVPATLRLYRRLRDRGYDNVGVVLQASLRRSGADLAALSELGANVRLVKGAYAESAATAFTAKADVDRNYAELIRIALARLQFTAIATHDDVIIERAIGEARGLGATGRFEFQTLLGVRPALAADLVARGFAVRVSVPFGADWYPYLLRRMAENPANLALVLRNWRL